MPDPKKDYQRRQREEMENDEGFITGPGPLNTLTSNSIWPINKLGGMMDASLKPLKRLTHKLVDSIPLVGPLIGLAFDAASWVAEAGISLVLKSISGIIGGIAKKAFGKDLWKNNRQGNELDGPEEEKENSKEKTTEKENVKENEKENVKENVNENVKENVKENAEQQKTSVEQPMSEEEKKIKAFLDANPEQRKKYEEWLNPNPQHERKANEVKQGNSSNSNNIANNPTNATQKNEEMEFERDLSTLQNQINAESEAGGKFNRIADAINPPYRAPADPKSKGYLSMSPEQVYGNSPDLDSTNPGAWLIKNHSEEANRTLALADKHSYKQSNSSVKSALVNGATSRVIDYLNRQNKYNNAVKNGQEPGMEEIIGQSKNPKEKYEAISKDISKMVRTALNDSPNPDDLIQHPKKLYRAILVQNKMFKRKRSNAIYEKASQQPEIDKNRIRNKTVSNKSKNSINFEANNF